MIQRIQSLYILVTTVLLTLTAILPLMELIATDGNFIFAASGITQGNNTILATLPLFILIIAASSLNAISLFSFRKRMLQIRLLVFSAILQLGSYGLGAYYLLQIKDGISGAMSPSIALTFPIVAVILSYLAIRSIGKDEALVKSLDRIR